MRLQFRLTPACAGAQIGSTINGVLAANRQYRYLDVFGPAGVNAPAGDLANVRAEFTNVTGGGAPLIGFCTVQDNQSFAADFRIAKSFSAALSVGGVSEVIAGTGLSGGGTTPTVTLSIATGFRLPQGCAANQIAKWSGSAWACAADATGAGGGTVTQVNTGTGLTGGPITTTGTVSVADAGIGTTQLANAGVTTAKIADASVTTAKLADLAVTTAKIADANVSFAKLAAGGCTNGQVLKFNGTAWACAGDAVGGTVTSVGTGAGLSGGPITGSGTINLAATQLLPAVACAANQVPKWSGSAWNCGADDGTNAFVQNGNAFGATAVLGTTDIQALELQANGSRVMRYEPNATSPNVIGGHPNNTVSGAADAYGQTVAGGGAEGAYCIDPSTNENTRSCANHATNRYATVSGGRSNTASGGYSTVGGGTGNTAAGYYATVAGGDRNAANGDYFSTVGGGSLNVVSGEFGSTVSGGEGNTASGSSSTVAGGGGNIASGYASTVAGGSSNTASGNFSFAAGYRAKSQTADDPPTVHHGAFVWADSQDADFHSTADNQFAVRASGGVRLHSVGQWNLATTDGDLRLGNDSYGLKFGVATEGGGTGQVWMRAYGGAEKLFVWMPGGTVVYSDLAKSTGVSLAPGAGAWSSVSDRARKENFAAVESTAVLERLARLPISTWNYKAQGEGIRHIGPMAQDFHAAFGVGENDTTISTVDAQGVALAAIQGLHQVVQEKDQRIAAQDREIAVLKANAQAQQRELAELRRLVDVLLARTAADARVAQVR